MNNQYARQLGKRLKDIRLSRALTQITLAEKAGIHSNYYAKIERGEVKVSLELASKIAKVLGVTLEDVNPL